MAFHQLTRNDDLLVLTGLASDTVYGAGGDDSIDGGTGWDWLRGQAGNDVLTGGIGSDRLHGGEGDDTLYGGNDQDLLFGGAGNDLLDGGAGHDVFWLGAGDDTYLGGSGIDLIYFAGLEGVVADLTGAPASESGHGVKRFESIEQVIGSAGDDMVTAGTGFQLFRGFGGNDTLIADRQGRANGDEGDDYLVAYYVIGGEGNDYLQGSYIHMDAGNDTISGWVIAGRSYSWLDCSEGSAVTIDLRITSVQDTGMGLDVIQGIGLVIGSAGNDSLTGTDQGDTFRGGLGDDTLIGGAGDDFLYGGYGVNLIVGGEGNDLIYGADVVHAEAGDDTIIFASTLIYSGSAPVTGSLYFHRLTQAGNGTDHVYGIGHLVLGDGDDHVMGSRWGTHVDGGAGNDTLSGRARGDRLIGGEGNDFLRSRGGNDLVDGGNGNDRLYGGRKSDLLLGGAGADLLNGGEGADTMDGGLDMDADRFVFGNYANNDVVRNFVSGIDIISLVRVDANRTLAGHQDLVWAGTVATARSVWVQTVGADTWVYADTSGDTSAEIRIRLEGVTSVSESDFWL